MKTITNFLFLISISAVFLIPSYLFANTRGISVVSKEGESLYIYNDYYALVVGVSNYDYWPDLNGAVKDAEEVAEVLNDIGINVILLLNPTSRELKYALNNLTYGIGKEENRAILLYYSGHGATELLATGEKLGYVVPKDCPILEQDPVEFGAKAISMNMIETCALRIKSKHVLMLFDSCFSGSVFASLKGVPSDISEKSNLPVRQFITAGNEDEQVPDNSIFTTCFIQGIGGEADYNKDRYITGTELGMYLDTNVVNYSRGSQHPQYGKIQHPKLDKGDFIFVTEGVVNATVPIVLPPVDSKDNEGLNMPVNENDQNRVKWAKWINQMSGIYLNNQDIDKSNTVRPIEKAQIWEQFLSDYSADNTYSMEDDAMRSRAMERVQYWENYHLPPNAKPKSYKYLSRIQRHKRFEQSNTILRSIPKKISKHEIKKMLLERNFYDRKWNKKGKFENDYETKTVDGDRVVIDYATGLMWQQGGSSLYISWRDAKEYVKETNNHGYAGFSDWRVPTIEELASLLEPRKKKDYLYINQIFDDLQSWCWSTDGDRNSPRIWNISFHYGVVGKDVFSHFYVRLVRSLGK